MHPRIWLFGLVWLLSTLPASPLAADPAHTLGHRPIGPDIDRSPVDLVLGPGESWLVTANQTSGSLSLVRTGDGRVLDEIYIGRRPAAIVLGIDDGHVLVTCSDSGYVALVAVDGDRLRPIATIHTGGEPTGLAVDHDAGIAYVPLAAFSQVVVIDLQARRVTGHIDVGRWPRFAALSPDGSRLAVGTSGDRSMSIVDTRSRQLLYTEKFEGLNIGRMQVSIDGQYVYFPWIIYRRTAITAENIRRGWVLASRIGRVRLDGPARCEAVSLDQSGQAVADPQALALTGDQQRILLTAGGTHELLVYRRENLPFEDRGGSDLIPSQLLADADRFFRIPLGGRPMGLRISGDDRLAYVANYLSDSIQVVDWQARKVIRTLALGGSGEPTLARRGEAIFLDGTRSLDQWYSCSSCHYDSGTNSVAMDTMNDGTTFTFKTVLPLHNFHNTAPWTWHGWQADATAAMDTSLTSTMLGPKPDAEDIQALLAYLKTLTPRPNPFRQADGSLSEAAARGQVVFDSQTAGCANCHSGPYFTDGQIHNVGTGGLRDQYDGFNTPSLIGVHQKVLLMHDGRRDTLDALLSGPHNPAAVTGLGELTQDQLRDLVEYLKSL
jgi:DNA-binding beta-propeller fold protein YncE